MPRRILVDLPTEPQRLSILESHLKGEQLDNVDLKMIAKQTTSYSGSDLKNVCVSAAVTCVKNMVSVLNVCRDSSMNSSECDKTTRILTQAHFDTALIEIPPSLTDEMQTLIELRKWNDAYGENANATKSKKKGWGFEREPLIS